SPDPEPATDDAQTDSEPAPAEGSDENTRPSIDELIELRALDVSGADIRDLRSVFPGGSLHEIAHLKAVGASADFVRDLRSVRVDVRRPEEASRLAGVGATAAM